MRPNLAAIEERRKKVLSEREGGSAQDYHDALVASSFDVETLLVYVRALEGAIGRPADGE